FTQQILGHIYSRFVERNVLDLNKELLSPGSQQRQVLANLAEIVLIFLGLELSPRISDLRAFKCFRLEKGFRCFYFLSILTEEDVVMHGLSADCRAEHAYHPQRRTVFSAESILLFVIKGIAAQLLLCVKSACCLVS